MSAERPNGAVGFEAPKWWQLKINVGIPNKPFLQCNGKQREIAAAEKTANTALAFLANPNVTSNPQDPTVRHHVEELARSIDLLKGYGCEATLPEEAYFDYERTVLPPEDPDGEGTEVISGFFNYGERIISVR